MDISDYLSEIQKISLLDPNEEKKLWHEYKDNSNQKARCEIIEAYQPLVFKCARPFCRMQSAMDLVQEGTVGLIEAVEQYDPSKHVAFSLYAVHRIKGHILNYLNKEMSTNNRSVYECLEDAAAIIDDTTNIAETAEQNFLLRCVQKVMLRLPPKERAVLNGVYIQDQAPQELANNLQVSLSHVYRLQKTAVRRVRGMMAKFMHHWN